MPASLAEHLKAATPSQKAIAQAIQAEAAQSQDLPQMSLSGGQHKLSMLYILDAVCSAAKQGQRGLQEKVRVQFRAMCSQILAQLVQMLATPVNCEKVSDLLRLWLRRSTEPVFEHAAITDSQAQLAPARALRSKALQTRHIGRFLPASHGHIAQLLVADWYGTFGPRQPMPADHPAQAKTAVDTGVHVQLRAAQPREPPLWLRQQPGHFDAAGTEHAATAPVDWADEAELTMRRAAAPAAVLDTVQQPHVKLERAETAGEGAPAAGGAGKDIKEAAKGAVAANGSENAPGEGNKQEAGEGPGRASDASEAVAVPAKRPLQGADSPAALASPTAKALYGEELDAEPAGTAQQPYGMHHPARAPYALAPSHAPQAQPYAQSGAPPPWAPPQQFQSEHQQQYWHAHAPFQAQPPHAAPQHHLAVPPAHTFQQPQSDPEYQPPLPEEPYEPDTEDAPPLPPGDPDEEDVHAPPGDVHAAIPAKAAESPPPLPSEDDEGDAAAPGGGGGGEGAQAPGGGSALSQPQLIPPPAPPAAAAARQSLPQPQPGFNHDAQDAPPQQAAAAVAPGGVLPAQPPAPGSVHGMPRVPSSAHMQPRAPSVEPSPAYPGLSAVHGQSPEMLQHGSAPYQAQAGLPTPAHLHTQTPQYVPNAAPAMRPGSMPGSAAMNGTDVMQPYLPSGGDVNGALRQQSSTPGLTAPMPPQAAHMHSQHHLGGPNQGSHPHMHPGAGVVGFQPQGMQPHSQQLHGHAYGIQPGEPMQGPPAGKPPQLPPHMLQQQRPPQPMHHVQPPGMMPSQQHSQHAGQYPAFASNGAAHGVPFGGSGLPENGNVHAGQAQVQGFAGFDPSQMPPHLTQVSMGARPQGVHRLQRGGMRGAD